MDNQLLQSRCAHVQFTLKKLGRAYASERIDTDSYRHQRALLIDYLLDVEKPFPSIILNQDVQRIQEVSQPHEFSNESSNELSNKSSIDFSVEETPMLDDLGFSEKIGPGGPLPEYLFKDDPLTSIEDTPNNSKDYYWFFLIFLMTIIVLLAVLVVF